MLDPIHGVPHLRRLQQRHRRGSQRSSNVRADTSHLAGDPIRNRSSELFSTHRNIPELGAREQAGSA